MNKDPRKQWYIDHGICYCCGQREAEPHKQLCFECAEKNSERCKKRYYSNRKAEIHNSVERKREKRRQREELGLCVECGVRKPSAGRKRCFRCLAKDRYRQKGYRERNGRLPRELRGDGLYCYQCCEPKCSGAKLCDDCRERSRKSAARAREHISKNGRYWSKLDTANIAEIRYNARRKNQ